MKRSVTNNLLLLIILGVNLCFLNTSCAQEPQQTICCEISALEIQIDDIEKLREDLKIKSRSEVKFVSVWEQMPGIKPSDYPDLKKFCDNSIKIKPLVDLASIKQWLLRLRTLSLDQYLILLKEVQCGQSAEQVQGGAYPNREDNVAFKEEGDPVEEKEIVDNYIPTDFISDPISYDKKSSFDVMDDIEYGRKENPKKYICVIYDPKSKEYGIDFLYSAPYKIEGQWDRLGSFQNTSNFLKKKDKPPVMLMNAGMFNPDYKPTGLFYRNGHKSFDFNNRTGLPGNFYMDPGGVFAIKDGEVATILTREEMTKNFKDTMNYQYATQSGPMLVIDGKLHPDFKSRSPNLNIRNGVGIMPDGKIVFVISKDEVNLFEFALLFKDGFRCKDALYLDGNISKIYAPSIKRLDPGGNFAGIIAIYKK